MLLFFLLSAAILLCVYVILINLNLRFIVCNSFGNNTKYKRKIELSLYFFNLKIFKFNMLNHKEKIENIIIKRFKNRKRKFKGIGKHILKLIGKTEILKLDFNFIAFEPINIDGYLNIVLKLKLIHILNMFKSIICERGSIEKYEGASNRRLNAYCYGKH